MVERSAYLDSMFGALSSPIRRDILKRVAQKELSVSAITKPYGLTFAAVSKHLRVLEEAKLISKRRQGKLFLVQLSPHALADATEHLRRYQERWESRLDALEQYLKTVQ